MTDLEQVEKYLKWAQDKVDEMKLYQVSGDHDSTSRTYVLNNLKSYISMAEHIAGRL